MIFPLRFKLALLTSVLLVAGLGTVATLLYSRYVDALEAEAIKRGRSIARNLANNAPIALLEQDDLVIENLLENTTKEPEVAAAFLLDRSGAVLASSPPDAERPLGRMTHGTRPLLSRIDGDRLIVASLMSFGGRYLGEAQVVLDLQGVVGVVVDRSRQDLYLASGGLLGLGILIAIATSGVITRPLRRLRLAVNALARGDTAARVAVTTRDEVADLARAFNEMSASLSEKRRVETAFRRYVSDHVLQQVIDQPETLSLAGERRDITVLFIDIREFTPLASSIEPEPLVAFLNEAFELISDRLLQHGATVDKYIGDAVLAYFGAPIESTDNAERAVAAAIAVQRSVEDRNKSREAAARPFYPLNVGIGIQTGPVVVGDIGSEFKTNYTIIGDPVNVANRLQKLALGGQILITGEVAKEIGDRVRLDFLGRRALEGRDEPVRVYQVLY